jgi:hypothetical protein
MTEATVIDPGSTNDADVDEGETASTTSDKKFSQADIDRVVADRVAREKAKYADYGDLKKKAAAAMSDHEKQVAEAEQRGATAERSKYGARLARAEFKAEAAGKVSPDALDGFLEYADLSRFLGDDGEPDSKAIDAAIKKLGGPAEKGRSTTNYDGGARTSAEKPGDMNSLIRRQAGLG